MAKRTLSKSARFERMFKILEYLKKNTDKEHPTTQTTMRNDDAVKEYIGDKQTFNRLIKDMARTLNSDEFGYKAEKDWKIYFDDFQKFFGDNAEESMTEEDYDEFVDQTMRISGLYYNRTFSYDEINSMIEGVLSAKTLSTKEANELIEKIQENLTTVFYPKGPKQICKIQEPELADRELLRMNLLTLQKAIGDQVQVSFLFNGYSHLKKLEPARMVKDTVSPYYIVANNGRYYLLACKEVTVKGELIKSMSIWRIDLMTEIEIPDRNEAAGKLGIRRIPKNQVENLPMEWSEDFQLKHLNMSYDRPIPITLRIKSEKQADDSSKRIRPDYTFLHDWFGDNFKYIKTENKAPYYDIVRVVCSPYAMTNWALQYSDRVEVLEPKSVRNAVMEKIRALNTKYGI